MLGGPDQALRLVTLRVQTSQVKLLIGHIAYVATAHSCVS